MKKIYGFAALAALALTSCSNENEPAPVVGGEEGVAGYIAVNLANPMGTRAQTFAYGDADENDVKSVKFVLFNADNSIYGIVDPTEVPQFTSNPTGQNVAETSEVVLVVKDKKNDNSAKPTQIMALLNLDGISIATTDKLSDVKAKVAQAAKNTKGFVMSNSAYVDGSAIYTTAIAPSDIKPTASDAYANPVSIYVERVAAKVTTTALSQAKADEGEAKLTYADGTEATFKINVKGVEIANESSESNLVKDLTGLVNPFADWNDATNHRSYWTVSRTCAYKNQSWKVINNTPVTASQKFYVNENSSNTTFSSVLVTAQLTVGNTDQTADIVMYNKQYYNENAGQGLKAIVNNLLMTNPVYVKSGDKYVTLSYDNFAWAGSSIGKGWITYLKLADTFNTAMFVKDATATGGYKAITKEEVNTLLKGTNYQAWRWNDGMCYYFKNIEHRAATEGNAAVLGIVRNHVYGINLLSINGLGVPVVSDEEPIIPEIPEKETSDEWSLAATINVLQWAVVSQDVNFDINY